MPGKKVTFDTVRKMALALPGVEESTSYGTPSFKLNGQLLTCTAINKAAEPNTLMVRISTEDRDELIEADPNVYYTADHYAPYPCVLVRLSRVNPDALRDLLLMGWRFMSSKKKSRRR